MGSLPTPVCTFGELRALWTWPPVCCGLVRGVPTASWLEPRDLVEWLSPSPAQGLTGSELPRPAGGREPCPCWQELVPPAENHGLGLAQEGGWALTWYRPSCPLPLRRCEGRRGCAESVMGSCSRAPPLESQR